MTRTERKEQSERRRTEVLELHKAGVSDRLIAEKLGVTRGRAWQIRNSYKPIKVLDGDDD